MRVRSDSLHSFCFLDEVNLDDSIMVKFVSTSLRIFPLLHSVLLSSRLDVYLSTRKQRISFILGFSNTVLFQINFRIITLPAECMDSFVFQHVFAIFLFDA